MTTKATPNVPVQEMQDIVTALDEHPEWRIALRNHLLSQELIELPIVFAKFATETTRRLDLLTASTGELKGAHAEATAKENIELIADELGLEYRRTIPRIELRHLARDNGADVDSDEIKSFVATDIIAETADADGKPTYIVVEASYTADRYDTERAIRHAGLMEQFTERRCRPVIASTRNSDRILPVIERGEVSWHQIRVRIQPAG